MRDLISAVRRWFDMNFTWKGLLTLLFFIVTAIPDWQSRGQYWNGRWHAITQFIVFSPLGRILVIFVGVVCIGLDHHSLMKRRKVEALQKAKPRKPLIQWTGYQFLDVIFDKDTGLWMGRHNQYSPKAYVFQFTNQAYEDGTGEHANLRAQIAWIYDTGIAGATFSPAAWVDEPYGMVDIPVGYSKRLIIGVKIGGLGLEAIWYGYHNPRIRSEDKHSLDGQPLPLGGTMLIKLIGTTNEVWYENRFQWKEDMYGYPTVTLLSPQ